MGEFRTDKPVARILRTRADECNKENKGKRRLGKNKPNGINLLFISNIAHK